MVVIDRKAIRIHELARLLAFLAELGHERAIVTREYLHSIVIGIDDQQETSMMVERQANWNVEDTIGIACLLGANQDLDSSISIKKKRSIVCHQSSNRETSDAGQCLPNPPKSPIKEMMLLKPRSTRRRDTDERDQATPTQRATSDGRCSNETASEQTNEREREREIESSSSVMCLLFDPSMLSFVMPASQDIVLDPSSSWS